MIGSVLAGTGQITAGLAARRKLAAAVTPWYLAGGISAANCIAAYQAIDADSLADSYINVANPGTYDLTANAGHHWAHDIGWALDGTAQYFAIPTLVPGNNWSVAVCFANGPALGVRAVFGHRLSADNGIMIFPTVSGSSGQRNYRYGNAITITSASVQAGVMAIAATKAYLNGAQETGTLNGTHTDTHTPYIGAFNNNGTAANFWLGTIQAVAIYDTDFSASVAALSTSMAALSVDIPATDSTPGVYITFDDNLEGVYDLAYPYMATRAIPGTIYTITDTVGTAGYMTLAQLLECQADGWDIANHTKTHATLTGLTSAQQRTELMAARMQLETWGFMRAASHASYPTGANNASTLTIMDSAGFRSGRTVSNGSITLPASSKFVLPAYRYYSGDSLATLQGNITTALAADNDIIVYMHNVVTSGGTAFDVTYAEFTALIDWLVSEDINCKTITQLPTA